MPIGVYVCHCGLNIAGVLNMEELKSFAETLPDVAVTPRSAVLLFRYRTGADPEGYCRSQARPDSCGCLLAASARAHLRRAITKAGLNPYMLEMANMRESAPGVTSTSRPWPQRRPKT